MKPKLSTFSPKAFLAALRQIGVLTAAAGIFQGVINPTVYVAAVVLTVIGFALVIYSCFKWR